MGARCAWLALFVVTGIASFARAERLSPADLERKNERGYVTGLPLVAYSTDIGFGGGVRVYYYWNGVREDPRFASTPYLHRLFVQAFASTKGIQFHWLDYDAPKVFDSSYRIRSQLIFGRNTNSNYFGVGNAGLVPLAYPNSMETFESYADYARSQQQVTNGMAWTKYDQFDLLRPLFIASGERSFFDDRVRVLAGFGLSYARIRDYSGQQVDAIDSTGASTSATMAPTRLREDCDAARLVGCDGGRENFLRFGLSYDTRDYEPDPNRGVFVDLALDVGTVALGSEYDYVRLLGAARGYWSPLRERADLVLAARGVLQIQSAGVPFFSMNSLPFTEDFRSGLGGHRTLRGYRQDRFVGRTMAVVNAELRWTFTKFRLIGQQWGLILVPFIDVGRSFESAGDLTLRDWRPSCGGAFRVSWNLATIVTVDYGVSAEDSGLYINFGHIF